MATKNVNQSIAQKILDKLTPEVKMHFIYQELFKAGIFPDDKEKVEEYFQKTYLKNQSLEDFAVSILLDQINNNMKRFIPKQETVEKPVKTKTETPEVKPNFRHFENTKTEEMNAK